MRKIVAIAGIAALSLGWALMPAGAGSNVTFDVSPGHGPPGTVVHTSSVDTGCNIQGQTVTVELVDQQEHIVTSGTAIVALDGSWAVDLTVPAKAAAGDYAVVASCTDGETSFTYNDQEFVVTASAPTTTVAPTTTTTTTVLPVPVVPQAVPPAPAAAPVVAAPVMTG